MALVVETGTGAAGSTSYVSVSDVRGFIGSIALSTATDTEIERAAILATRYLDGKYRARWVGVRMLADTQPLEWPRYVNLRRTDGYIDALSATIPQAIKDATCELALRALTSPLAPDIAPRDRVIRKKIDIIETEFSLGDFTTSYPVVDQLIGRFLKSPSEAIRG